MQSSLHQGQTTVRLCACAALLKTAISGKPTAIAKAVVLRYRVCVQRARDTLLSVRHIM